MVNFCDEKDCNEQKRNELKASYKIPKVQCLEEGWTVIQSRGPYGNPRDFFFKKNWEDYAKGFGKSGN